ncbi:MAG: glycoside hydrolase family 16 protein [Lachnospiraceae bacterium]|nr:glycoside hydrolase family 16 protein [Lachnospiraceae bacterium]
MPNVPTDLKPCEMVRITPVEGHAESLVPADKQWKLVWSDEFDGDSLDETKWNYRLNFWGYRSPTWTTEGVVVSDGTLKINMIRKGDDFYSAHLQTGGLTFDNPRDETSKVFWPFGKKDQAKFMHRYGYYECRCKLPKNDGWHAAFWLQAPGIGSHPDPAVAGVECDIMENYRQHKDGSIVCGCGWGGYGNEGRWFGHFQFPFEETADGWHTYGVDWSPEGYIFYADGQLVGKQMAPECPVSKVEQFILVSTECHGYNRIFRSVGEAGEAAVKSQPVPELLQAVLPDCFEVDYVRVFDAV